MKRYEGMNREEVAEIIRRGGDALTELNKEISKYLDTLALSSTAAGIVAATAINNMAETFGGMYTAEEIEAYCREYYPEEYAEEPEDVPGYYYPEGGSLHRAAEFQTAIDSTESFVVEITGDGEIAHVYGDFSPEEREAVARYFPELS